MATRAFVQYVGCLVSAGVLLTACSQYDASQQLAVLDSDPIAAIPEAVHAVPDLVEGSVRLLGEHHEKTYYVARYAPAADHQVCLVEMDPRMEEASAGCSGISSMTDDKIVTLEGASSTVALVTDDPSTEYLEEAGWQQITDNLWAKDSPRNL